MPYIRRICSLIRQAESVFVCSHVRTDGDALGSVLALASALRQMGKRVVASVDSQIPDIYTFLPGIRRLAPVSKVTGRFDVAVALDTPNPERLGALQKRLDQCQAVINIDHHRTTRAFGHLNWVDTRASSVGEMVYRLLGALRLPINDRIAQCLYTAIVTDTGRFTYANTTPQSMRIAAKLLEDGLDLVEVTRNVYQSTSREVFALRALAMETVEYEAGGRIGIMCVTRRMIRKTGARLINTQDFVDIPRSIKGVSVAVFLSEMDKPGWIKASLRSDRSVEVDKVAVLFGGGGHARAAGCEIHGTLQEARRRLLAAIKSQLRGK